MIEFSIPEADKKEVEKRCEKYQKMNLQQLKDEVKKLDKSDHCVLIKHDSMRNKKLILDFLFFWEYFAYKGGCAVND